MIPYKNYHHNCDDNSYMISSIILGMIFYKNNKNCILIVIF